MKKPTQPINIKKTSGFALHEIVIALAVIAILVTGAFPLISSFLDKQLDMADQNVLEDISRAMDVYIKENRTVPTDVSWTEVLDEYTDLSQKQIRQDSFGRNRYYRSVSRDITYRNATITKNYAFIIALGSDGCIDTGGNACVTATGDAAVVDIVDDLLGSDSGDYEANYNNLNPADGDFLVKFTDSKYKDEMYKITVERMKKVIEALEQYAQTEHYRAVGAATSISASDLAQQQIFFPKSENAGSDGLYGAQVLADANSEATISGNDIYNDNNNNTRYNEMRGLMKILGLPASYCCNALENFKHAGKIKDMPFYYCSNPKVNSITPNTLSSRRVSPKLTTTPSPCD